MVSFTNKTKCFHFVFNFFFINSEISINVSIVCVTMHRSILLFWPFHLFLSLKYINLSTIFIMPARTHTQKENRKQPQHHMRWMYCSEHTVQWSWIYSIHGQKQRRQQQNMNRKTMIKHIVYLHMLKIVR